MPDEPVQRVLERFIGYAAILDGNGHGEKGVLHTIDINDEIEGFLRCNYIERSGLVGQIVFISEMPVR